MKNYYRAIVLLLTVCVFTVKSPAQQLGFRLDPNLSRVRIPFEVINNLIVIPITLNNALPLKFILDTGVRNAILTQKAYSDFLNMPYSRTITISGAGGEKLVDAYVTHNVSFGISEVRGDGHAMLVLDKDYLELRSFLGMDVHGILGYELFTRFVVKIDYGRKVLTLIKPKKFKPPRSFKAIPFTLEDTKPFILADMLLNDSIDMPVKLMVDTGASHGLLLEAESDNRINVPSQFLAANLGRGLGGNITGKIARVNELRFDDNMKFENLLGNFPDPGSYFDSLKASKVVRNGTIGGEILSRFTVIFDYPNQKIYLKKNSDFKKDFVYNLSGLVIKAIGVTLDQYEVEEVQPNSAGDLAGIHKGDKILRINNHPTHDMSLEVVTGFFNSRNKRKLKLVILRGKKIIKKDIVLKSQI